MVKKVFLFTNLRLKCTSRRLILYGLVENSSKYIQVVISNEFDPKITINLEKIDNTAHDWMLCRDTKVACLLDHQREFIKFTCFHVNETVGGF